MRLKWAGCVGCISIICVATNVGLGSIMIQNTIYAKNWSGYFATAPSGQAFTDISSTWVMPAVQPPVSGTTYSCYWVGFDGVTDDTVEQCGIEANIDSGGSASYYAWYEFAPVPEQQIYSIAVHPGDTINAEVTYEPSESTSGTYAYYFAITDQTNGQSFRNLETTSSNDARSSAEWIAEAPTVGQQIATVANFGSVTFSNDVAALDTGNDQTISTFNDTDVDLKQNGIILAIPTPFDSSGETFTINYVPEPSAIGILALGGLAMLTRRRKRRRQAGNT